MTSLPICEACAKSSLLCEACDRRLEAGEITPLDVELARVVHEVGGGVFGFKRVIDAGEHIILLVDRAELGVAIGKGGVNIQKIMKRTKRKARVVGVGDAKDMLADLTSPARAGSVSSVHLPDGRKVSRVKIKASEAEKLRIKPEDIEKIIEMVSGEKTEIIVEKEND